MAPFLARASALLIDAMVRDGAQNVPTWDDRCWLEMGTARDGNASKLEESFNDDGVQFSRDPPSEIQAAAALENMNIAPLWKQCYSPFKHADFPAMKACVVSEKHNFMYLENVKAGSTSIRELLARTLGVSWCSTDAPHKSTVNEHSGMTFPSDFDKSFIDRVFKFSFVRDPVKKFESGVRQAWISNPSLKQYTADQLLDMQLAKPFESLRDWSGWVQDHLQPSSYSLASSTNAYYQAPINVDFIGRIESMGAAWSEVVYSMADLTNEERGWLLGLSKENSHPVDPRSKLSDRAIKKMCASRLYGQEWTCFGYEYPAACM